MVYLTIVKLILINVPQEKYQGINNHIGGSLNLTLRKSMLGDFT